MRGFGCSLNFRAHRNLPMSEEVFAKVDTDGSGTLDQEEVDRLAAALGVSMERISVDGVAAAGAL